MSQDITLNLTQLTMHSLQRGLVPVLQYTPPSFSTPLTLTESAQIVSFFTDIYSSHLLPILPAVSTNAKPDAEEGIRAAHLRYRMSFFVDTYFTKINPLMFKLVGAEAGDPQDKIADEMIKLVGKEIE